MKQYYNAKVPKSVASKLQEKKCPYADKIDMGFTVPDIVDRIPTYAEVLDWLIEKGVKISIGVPNNKDEWFTITDKSQKIIRTDSFTETLDQTILFILEFI